MKNILTIATIILSLVLVTGCEKDVLIPENEIPTEIKTYIATHFAATSISRAEKENNETERYEITLANGVKLEFNKQTDIIDIDWNAKLPDSVIPANILLYVNSNYATSFIIGWELQTGSQEVQLNNDLVLVFDMAGEFLSVGD